MTEKPLHHYANAFDQWTYLFSLAGVDVYGSNIAKTPCFRVQVSRHDYHLYTTSELILLEVDYPEAYFALMMAGRLSPT